MKCYILWLNSYTNELIGIFDTEEKAVRACADYMIQCNGMWKLRDFEIEEKEMNVF